MNVVKITFSIDPDDLKRMDELAAKQKRSRSSLIRWLVEEEYQRRDAQTGKEMLAAFLRDQQPAVE